MIKLSNPRGYLSWSQIDLWQRSPTQYIRKYFYGEEDQFKNKFMEFGKTTATALETGETTNNEIFDLTLSLLPKYSKMEHEISTTLKTPNGIIKIMGKLDTFDPETINFREYKTGKTVWTQKRADNHKQLHFYQLLIWQSTGRLAPQIDLDWLETEQTGLGVAFTGRTASFGVKIGLQEVLEYAVVVSRVAVEIDAAYCREFQNIT